MDELIARLEKATGPDRELDADIAIAIFVPPEVPDDLICAQRRNPGHDATHPGHYFIKTRSGAQAQSAPYYTTSIDAALTLVPKGHEYEMGSANLVKSYWASVIGLHNHKAKGMMQSTALAAAALKARSEIDRC